MQNALKITLSTLAIILVLLSCTKDKSITEPEVAKKGTRKTILVYMAADNNLYQNAERNLQDMVKSQIPSDCNLIVYLDMPSYSKNPKSQLLWISNNKTEVLKVYDNQNSASPAILNQIIHEVTDMFPATSNGLVLWSHATAWLPKGGTPPSKTARNISSPLVKAYAEDNGSEMDIIDLANALDIKFDFILFDACFMSSIEVCYQLRNKADYIIASPAEVLSTGFPYIESLPYLFAKPNDYVGAAKAFMSSYRSQSGEWKSATVSVINTRYLSDLAMQLHGMMATVDFKNLDRSQIQNLDRFTSSLFFDLENYLEQVLTPDDLATIKLTLDQLIVFTDFTDYLIDLPITRSCGISTYIPYTPTTTKIANYYYTLAWYKDVY